VIARKADYFHDEIVRILAGTIRPRLETTTRSARGGVRQEIEVRMLSTSPRSGRRTLRVSFFTALVTAWLPLSTLVPVDPPVPAAQERARLPVNSSLCAPPILSLPLKLSNQS